MIGSSEYSGASLESHRRRRSVWLVVGLMLLMNTDISMAFFFNKVLEANEFLEVLNE
jgi:hypothetical protein